MKWFGKVYYSRGFLKLIVLVSRLGRKAILFECTVFSIVNCQITFFKTSNVFFQYLLLLRPKYDSLRLLW